MKKLLSALLIMTMLFSVTACSSSTPAPAPSTAPDAASTDAAGAPDAAAPATSGDAGSFPTGPITILVGFSAGGATDLGARYMAASLEKELGVPVMIENIPGSSGWLALNKVLKNSPKDGYSIGIMNHNFPVGIYDDATPRTETLDDVELLANQVIDYNILAIRSDETRFTDLASFIEYSKNNDLLVCATATGITDGDASCVEWFKNEYGAKMTIVPTDSGVDAKTMFVAGDVDILLANTSDAYTAYNSGEMKIITQFSDERTEWLPDVPTMKELHPDKYFIGFSSRGYFYAKGVDPAIVEKVKQGMLVAMEDEKQKENLNKLGLTLLPLTGQEFEDLVNQQLEARKLIWGIE